MTQIQINRLVKVFAANPLAVANEQQVAQIMGYMSVAQLARKLNVTSCNLKYKINKDLVLAPTIPIGKRMFYDGSTAEKLIKDWQYRKMAKGSVDFATARKIKEIYLAGGLRQSDVAEQFGTSQGVVSRICMGKGPYKFLE